MVRDVKRTDDHSRSLAIRKGGKDDIRNVELIFENQSAEEIQDKLNTWLMKIKVPLRVMKIAETTTIASQQTPPLPHREILDLLSKAYSPCLNFGICQQAKFEPLSGHVPRGFLGATGSLADVKVVLLFAEPGHPHNNEKYPDARGEELLSACLKHVYDCFKNSKDRFHYNTRWVLDQLFPNLAFDDQLKHVWLTEARLCSIDDEIGRVRGRECAEMYLVHQLNLLPNAMIIAFGNKAQDQLEKIRKHIKQPIITAFALSPPGANQKRAKPSWDAAISAVRAHLYKVSP